MLARSWYLHLSVLPLLLLLLLLLLQAVVV
jgi:hypothetical protein